MKPLTAFSGVFVLMLLMTEFKYINFGGGIVRPYHFLVPVVLFLFLPGASRLATSSVARAIGGILLVSVVSMAASQYPGSALRSLILLALNMTIAFSVAVLPVSGRFTFHAFSETLRIATLIMCAFSILQFVAFRLGGASLALSEDQYSQMVRGFAPGFFNEANGFAKYLLAPMFFFLPVVIRRGFTKRMLVLYGFMVLAFFINFMRSATGAILVTLIVASLWYVKMRVFSAFARRFVAIGSVTIVVVVLALNSGLSFSEYNTYKFSSLFDLDALATDDSWEFRAAAMQLAIQQTLSDPVRFWIGNGWGQVYAFVGNEIRQVGGADLVNFFAYNGLFGVLSFLALGFTSIRSAARAARAPGAEMDRMVGEGVLFALVAYFALGLVSGVNLLASFWVMIGLAMAMEKLRQRETASARAMEHTA